MTTKPSQLVAIECLPGVEPDTDKTAFATKHFTFSDKIRFVDGLPEKIGGWLSTTFSNDMTIQGTSRSIFSATINGRVYTMIGTNEKLYVLIGSTLTNITPLDTDTIAIANGLDTHYATLSNNPISVTNGSNTVTITDSEYAKFKVGDTVTISGATTTGGILNTALNAAHVIRSIGVGSYTIRVATSASSTATGGGASVVRSSGLITVTHASHGQANGDRVKITGAADTGGIVAADINIEFIIRNVATNSFDIMTEGTATSSVTGGGGASTEYQQEIPAGLLNASFGQGYGMGMYGVGLYGVSKLSTAGQLYPRIWFFDRFGNTIIMTPGNQTGLYQWDGVIAEAPALVSGAPDEINYAFVSDNIAVTLGYQEGNEIFSSDQGAITQWTASSTNQVFQDDIEGAGRFLSHVSVNGTNLLFTENQTYTFQYVGLPLIWDINLLESSVGIISPMARIAIEGVAYWMDDNNFYKWEGGNVQVIPSNSNYQTTIHNYVFGDLNTTQKSKIFCWYNQQFNEIWWHYLSESSNEPDRVARFNIKDQTWCPDTLDRTAGEYPIISLVNPRLMNVGTLYKHEIGTDDDLSPMEFTLKTNLRTGGKETTTVVGIIPDSLQSGDLSLTIHSQLWPQATATMKEEVVVVAPDTTYIPYTVNGRFWDYEWTGDELGQTWQMGRWQEYVQKGADF
jgi:hypothetical protein